MEWVGDHIASEGLKHYYSAVTMNDELVGEPHSIIQLC